MPASPEITTTPPRPARADESAAPSAVRSPSRPTNGRASVTAVARRPVGAPTTAAATGCDLPLTRNGSRCVTSKTPRNVVEQRLGRDDLAGLAAAHDARCEVGGVAHDGVGPPGVGADVDGEGTAAVDPRAHLQGAVHCDRVAEDEEHPLLVALAEPGSTCDQQDLAAVGVDVGGEERDPVRDAGPLCRHDDGLHRGGDGVRSPGVQQLVGPA